MGDTVTTEVETQEVEVTTAEETTETKGTPEAVPYARLQEVTKARRAAEKQAAELAARLKEIEDSQKSELDKARDAAAEAERKASDLEAQIAAKDRNFKALAVAQKLGWAEPEMVAALIDWSELEADMSNLDKLVEDFTTAHEWVKGAKAPVGSANAGDTGEKLKAATLDEQIAQAVKDGNADLELALNLKKAQGG